MASIPFNILINNHPVADDLVSCSISADEKSYCLSVSLALKSKRFWGQCNPSENHGELIIQVSVGDVNYEFLCEERDTSVDKGVSFRVWGRSKQALLAAPFSKKIIDTETTNHPWQTGNTTAEDIITHVIDNYCPYTVTVNWNAIKLHVYEDTLTVNNQSPIEIIGTLAKTVGAIVRANPDGTLSVDEYVVTNGVSIATYNDLDHITQIDESNAQTERYNAVTVFGFDSGSGQTNAYISAESQFSGTIYPSRYHTVRVYYHHSGGETPRVSSCSAGISAGSLGSGNESVSENVQLLWGVGNRSQPDTNGDTEITGSATVPCAVSAETYNVRYKDFTIAATVSGNYQVVFYFDDLSAYTTYSFAVGSLSSEADNWNVCDGLKIELESPATPFRGSNLIFRAYGPSPREGKTSGGGKATKIADNRIDYSEAVTFTNGEASLTYPAEAEVSVEFSSGSGYSPVSWSPGSSKIVARAFVDQDDKYIIHGIVTYEAKYETWRATIPKDWETENFSVWFLYDECATQSSNHTLTFTVSGVGSSDDELSKQSITVIVKDYTSGAVISGARVTIDGSYKGTTNGDGELTVSNVSLGSHSIVMTKSGYINSAVDGLDNDSFILS